VLPNKGMKLSERKSLGGRCPAPAGLLSRVLQLMPSVGLTLERGNVATRMRGVIALLQDYPWLVLLAAWGAAAAVMIYFFWSRSRARERQAVHACTRCARPLGPMRVGLMCERCERRTRFTGRIGCYFCLGMSALFFLSFLVLLTTEGGRQDVATLATSAAWAAATYYMARRIRSLM
jgi:hypothetical protein